MLLRTNDEIEALVAGKVLTFGTKKVEEETKEEATDEAGEEKAEVVAESEKTEAVAEEPTTEEK